MGARLGGWRGLWLGIGLAVWLAPAASAQNLYTDLQFGGSVGQQDAKADRTGRSPIRVNDDDDDRSIMGGGSLGFRFPLAWAIDRELPRAWPDVHFRIEAEVTAGREYQFDMKANNAPSGLRLLSKFEAVTLLGNFFVEVPFYRNWALYAGAGLGPAFTENKVEVPSIWKGKRDKTTFAWNVGTGIEYAFDDQVSMGFGYRYLDMDDVNLQAKLPPNFNADATKVKTETTAHEFMVRVRVNFYNFLD